MKDLSKLTAEDVMLSKDKVDVIHEEEKVAVARLKMLRKAIGGLPVVDQEERLVGIITFRDLDLLGAGVHHFSVKDVMTKKLFTVRRRTTFQEIVTLMCETGLQRLPVTEKGKLAGLVTQGCVIRAVNASLK